MTATHGERPGTSLNEWATGVTVFAAIMLMVTGIIDVVRGVAEIAEDDIFATTRTYIFAFDLTAWGWIHAALGAVAFIISFGLFRASTWARVTGVAVAALVIIANFLSLPYYPAWSIVMIAASGFIIWALCAMKKDEDLSRPRDRRRHGPAEHTKEAKSQPS
ncbi:hypothetical protein ACIQU3_18870 [Streptomyces sp. NPDC101110]|uniref:DUF7144 family membrane protein n=1 Tax=Streptomyces sp. NPDC101110 TaxID=3366104 RepID=UPI00381C3463